MDYVSTRGAAPTLEFDEVLLAGLASDGGLYLPSAWPRLSQEEIRSLRGLTYVELATRVMRPYVEDTIGEAEFSALVAESYAGFDHDAIAPLKQIEHDTWLMELFHGPTLAFKDYALQLVGRLFDHVLTARGRRVTIVGATSGDTGSAAIEACRDRAAIDIFILHPHGRTSEVQRRQMTTVQSANVHNLAIEGTFDDCQALVKEMFGDAGFRSEMGLSAVNSINWARVMAQIVYYFHAAVALGAPDRRVSFAVPTGNFGNIFAAWAAKAMGLPVDQLIIGSNSNDILTRFFETGTMSVRGVTPTVSPSMDIQDSSNFERYLFELLGRDGEATAGMMQRFREAGEYTISPELWSLACETFSARRFDDDETVAGVAALHASTGELVDPHSAVGVLAGCAARRTQETPLVCLGCAHPAKFPDTVQKATGRAAELPERLADLFEREERYDVLAPDLAAVQSYVRARTKAARAPA